MPVVPSGHLGHDLSVSHCETQVSLRGLPRRRSGLVARCWLGPRGSRQGSAWPGWAPRRRRLPVSGAQPVGEGRVGLYPGLCLPGPRTDPRPAKHPMVGPVVVFGTVGGAAAAPSVGDQAPRRRRGDAPPRRPADRTLRQRKGLQEAGNCHSRGGRPLLRRPPETDKQWPGCSLATVPPGRLPAGTRGSAARAKGWAPPTARWRGDGSAASTRRDELYPRGVLLPGSH